ncbi:very short patch repair endonuclease [Sphingomicrobium arenosum]|uniref:very short patch repair endonuclease n=1 Tax=Sphingomicrobium arenosum TaxID=2233861 RepID=UPI002240F458|nr:very short patch repair endonuclease [Sphingomicrobium arenosum]
MDLPRVSSDTSHTDKAAPVTPARSRLMARVRSRNTKPELRVRQALHALGYRFRLHRRDLPGTPDIVLPRYRTAIFVHGCFWHRHEGCRKTTMPKTRASYWRDKFAANVARDRRKQDALEHAGWRCVTVWECETENEVSLRDRLISLFGSGK